MSWKDIIKNDMEEYERDMLSEEQRGSNQKVPKEEMDDLKQALESINEVLSNKTIMEQDDTGDLKDSLKRTRASLGSIIQDYKESPYLDIEE